MKTERLLYLITFACAMLFTQNTHASGFFGGIKDGVNQIFITIQHKSADKKFDGLAYAKAIEKYENLVEKGFSPDSVRRNLAISYFKINETQKSEELFNGLIVNNEAIDEDYYFYAQSLKYNKKYDEADKWIDKYKLLKGQDSRADIQYKASPVIKEIYNHEKYKIESAYFNSEYTDFGAITLNDQVIFSSGRNDQAIIKYEYSWKGHPYLDLYAVSEEKATLYKEPDLMSKGINSRFHDGPICYSADGSEVFVTRNRFVYGMPNYSEDKENNFMLYHAKSKDGGWEDMEELPFNSPEYSCGHPALSADNSTLYFASDMPGGYGESDIYYATRTDSGWSTPVNLGSDINTEGDEMFPFISETGELYFASNGQLGLGGLDVYMAQKIKEGKYGILNMGYPLNSEADDFSFYLKKDGLTGYFASNREGGKGDDDIYKFTMLEKPAFRLNLSGTTIDKKTGEIIPEASVRATNSDGEEIYKGTSNAQGKFEFEVVPGLYYTLETIKDNYSQSNEKILADKSKAAGDVFEIDILLSPVEEWGVFGFIFEKESGEGVSEVAILITEIETGTVIGDITDVEGKFRRLLKSETDYNVLLTKEKFFTRRGDFSTKGMEPGWIDIKEFIEVEMEEIEVGKTIEIPNIYYDVAKWNIRPDAAVELDKVVQFLSDNPGITIELGSHTDARGSSSSNQTLSQKRAESAVSYIVSKGVSSDRITAKGYGETRLKNHCADGITCSKDEHQANRRTEIKIVDF